MVMCPDHHRFVDWLRPQDYSEQILYDMKARVESETDRDGAVVWTHGDALLEAIARSAIIGYRISLGDYGEAGETIASITDRLNTRHTTGTLSFGGVAAAASGASGNLTVAHEDRALAEDGAVASATVRQEATVSPAPIQLAVEMPQPNAQAVDLEPAVLHLQGVPLDPQTTSADPSDTSTPGTSVNAHAGVAEASGAAGVATIHTTAEHSDDEPPEP